MKKRLLDLIDELNFAEVFRIIEENASQFPNYQHFRNEYMLNYTAYNGTKQHAYRETLKIFINSRLSSQFNAQSSPFNAPFLTSFTPAGKVIGRQESIDELHTHLQQPEALPTVVVNGLGGIGKTTLVRKYVWDYQAYYNHLVWLEQTSTLLNAFILNERLTAGKDFEGKNELTRFREVMQDLESRQGKNLLIIDNYAFTDTDTAHNLLAYFRKADFKHWRVLFTSREQIHGFIPIRLGTLSESKAIELFCMYVPKERIDETELKELLKLIDYHTLTIELLAKSYQNSLDLENLAQLTDILRKNALDAEALNKPIYVGDSQEEKLLYQHLDTIFNITHLDEASLYVLKQLAVLPALPHAGKDFLAWIVPTDSPTDTNLPTPAQTKATYEKALFALAKKGWLIYNTDKTFEMHRLMQMFLLRKCSPTITECEPLVDSFIDLLDMNKVIANPLAHQWALEYGKALLAGIHFDAIPIQQGYLQERLARLYENLGIYTQAEKLYQDALRLKKEVLGTKHPEYAIALNNLALLYKTQGKYAEAEPLYQEALQIDKETIGIQHPDYAIDLNNLASLYDAQGYYTEAEPLYKEALQIEKEAVGIQHPNYAIYLNNLANLYRTQGKYTEAELLYKEVLQIDKETIGTQHPAYATHLNNLGSMYYEMGRYEEAKALLIEAHTIFVATLGEEHPSTQITKGWLKSVEANL